MESLGTIIRKLRDERKLPLRTVAAFLDIDQAILSRVERGQRKVNRDQVIKLAQYFNASEDELLIAWLSDKVLYDVANEELGLQALIAAEERVKYQILKKQK